MKKAQHTKLLNQNELNKITIIEPTNLYSAAERRLSQLEEIRKEKEKAINGAPEGKIHIVNTKKRVSFYLRLNAAEKSGKYLSKSNHALIQKYVQKAYDIRILGMINKEISILTHLLKCSDHITDRMRQLYSDQSEKVKEYITPIDLSDEDYARAWTEQPYTGKPISDDIPCYETEHKEHVRSKSELNIANALAKHGIPYKYEHPLRLHNGRILYPDFTILDTKKRQVVYWEHRGMMDDPEYANHTVSRIKAYLNNGIIIGKNLIITEETSACPLGTNEIEAVIRHFF